MLHFFALSENKAGTDLKYHAHIKAMINSAKKNTKLKSIFIYDGKPNSLTKWLVKQDVEIVYHRSSIADFLIESKVNDKDNLLKDYNPDVALGTFLRIDIPIIMDKLKLTDEVVLYTDCDVLFNMGLENDTIDLKGRPLCVCRETNYSAENPYYNTGVMFINIPVFRKSTKDFVKFIKESVKYHKFQDYDQMAICMYYHGRIMDLTPYYNWRTFHGINKEARIIHYHGIKIDEMKACVETGKHPIADLQGLYEHNRESVKYYYELFQTYI